MWSNIYAYYLIRGNAAYSAFLPVEDIIEILKNTGVLRQKQRLLYANKDHFPWIDIGIAHTTDGNFSIGPHSVYITANLISVTTSRDTDQQIYLDLLTRIAAQLSWELIMEEDEEENEEVIIFTPIQ